MTFKLAAITAAVLAFGATGAMAQAAGAQAGATQEDRMPMGWEGNVGGAFYSDPALGTLRSETEMRANWAGLSEEDQALVREYCEQHPEAEAGAVDAGVDAEAAAELGAGTHQASLRQICDMIAS